MKQELDVIKQKEDNLLQKLQKLQNSLQQDSSCQRNLKELDNKLVNSKVLNLKMELGIDDEKRKQKYEVNKSPLQSKFKKQDDYLQVSDDFVNIKSMSYMPSYQMQNKKDQKVKNQQNENDSQFKKDINGLDGFQYIELIRNKLKDLKSVPSSSARGQNPQKIFNKQDNFETQDSQSLIDNIKSHTPNIPQEINSTLRMDNNKENQDDWNYKHHQQHKQQPLTYYTDGIIYDQSGEKDSHARNHRQLCNHHKHHNPNIKQYEQ